MTSSDGRQGRCKPSVRIDGVHFAGRDQRGDDGPVFGPGVVTGKEGVLATRDRALVRGELACLWGVQGLDQHRCANQLDAFRLQPSGEERTLIHFTRHGPPPAKIAQMLRCKEAIAPNTRQTPKLTPSGATEAGLMRCSLHTAQPRRASGVSAIRGS